MNEVEKMEVSANRVAVINVALNRSTTYVLREYGPMCQTDPRLALRYLASLCATVIGGYTEIVNPDRDTVIIAKLIEIQIQAFASYMASNGDGLIEIETEEA